MDTERIKITMREKVTAENFLAYLKDHGFSVYFRRDGFGCPLARWLQSIFGEHPLSLGVSHTEIEFYSNQDNRVVAMKFLHSDGRQWMRNFVQQVDTGPYSQIEGWQAAQIMENLLRPYKPFVQPDALSLLRKLRLAKSKEKVYA